MLMRTIRLITAALGLTLALLALPAVGLAQDGSAPKKPPPGFEPVAGAPDTEKVDANKLVVAAYAVFFLGIFGYGVLVVRRQTELAKEMEELARRIPKADA